jgi:hypothetical protein
MSYLDKLKDKISATLDYKSKLSKFILPAEEKNKRIDICNSCEFLFTPTRSCKKCGCFVDGKAALARSECPMSKWPKIIVSED